MVNAKALSQAKPTFKEAAKNWRGLATPRGAQGLLRSKERDADGISIREFQIGRCDGTAANERTTRRLHEWQGWSSLKGMVHRRYLGLPPSLAKPLKK
jgi:hypothetical protein